MDRGKSGQSGQGATGRTGGGQQGRESGQDVGSRRPTDEDEDEGK